MQDANYLKKVREQYENFPYPIRNPEDEKRAIHGACVDSLDFLNYFHYSGNRNFLDSNFRVLVAGGGTGDSLVYMSEQLRDTSAEIVYLDISKASMEVAKERIKVRGIDGNPSIKWVSDSILNISKLNLGRFDFINCSGVLHHLANPDEGLRALESVLKDDGVISLMLYGKHGRVSIYQIQELMSMVNYGEENLQNKVDNCKKILANLPSSHMFHSQASGFNDMKNDIGIYDLFLHSQDRAYAVLDLYKLANSSNLQISYFFAPGNKVGNNAYNPAIYLKDSDLLQKVRSFNPVLQQAIAESLNGSMSKHEVYMVRSRNPLPDISDLDNVPSLSIICLPEKHSDIYHIIKGASLNKIVNFSIQAFSGEIIVSFKKTNNIENIFKFLDGERPLKDIFCKVREESGKKISDKVLLEEFKSMFYEFNIHNCMYLRHKSVPAYKNSKQMQNRVSKLYAEKAEA